MIPNVRNHKSGKCAQFAKYVNLHIHVRPIYLCIDEVITHPHADNFVYI